MFVTETYKSFTTTSIWLAFSLPFHSSPCTPLLFLPSPFLTPLSPCLILPFSQSFSLSSFPPFPVYASLSVPVPLKPLSSIQKLANGAVNPALSARPGQFCRRDNRDVKFQESKFYTLSVYKTWRLFSNRVQTRFIKKRMGVLLAPYRVDRGGHSFLFTRRWQKLARDSSAATNPPHRLALMHPLTAWLLRGWSRGRRGHHPSDGSQCTVSRCLRSCYDRCASFVGSPRTGHGSISPLLCL